MAQTVLITLTTAGANTGPFDLYSDADGYVTPFENNVPKSSLVSGYTSTLVPDLATIVRVQSDGQCVNFIDLTIVTTTTTTTTAAPVFEFPGSGYSNVNENGACSDAVANNRTLTSDCAVIGAGCVIFTDLAGTSPLVGNSYVFIASAGNFDVDPLSGVVVGPSAIQC